MAFSGKFQSQHIYLIISVQSLTKQEENDSIIVHQSTVTFLHITYSSHAKHCKLMHLGPTVKITKLFKILTVVTVTTYTITIKIKKPFFMQNLTETAHHLVVTWNEQHCEIFNIQQ
jgi:hypothetical protein